MPYADCILDISAKCKYDDEISQIGNESNTVFLIYDFSMSEEIIRRIRDICKENNLELKSLEDIDPTEIRCGICKSIQISKFIISDVSFWRGNKTVRPNIAFELGLSYGLKKQVILLYRRGKYRESDFSVNEFFKEFSDLQGRNLLAYSCDDLVQFTRELDDRIKQVVTPPNLVPFMITSQNDYNVIVLHHDSTCKRRFLLSRQLPLITIPDNVVDKIFIQKDVVRQRKSAFLTNIKKSSWKDLVSIDSIKHWDDQDLRTAKYSKSEMIEHINEIQRIIHENESYELRFTHAEIPLQFIIYDHIIVHHTNVKKFEEKDYIRAITFTNQSALEKFTDLFTQLWNSSDTIKDKWAVLKELDAMKKKLELNEG